METIFSKVKAAIGPHADDLLRDYGVKHVRGVRLSGEWTTGFLCPFCGDKSGSASFTHELYLKCHQCSLKLDVFDWLAKHLGKRQLDVARELAERLHVDVAAKSKRTTARSMPNKMTEDVLEHAVRDLWDHKDAQPARDVLSERGLDDQKALMELEIGWIRGWIVFVRRDDGGRLEERYRGWAPKGDKIKWQWFGNGTGGVGIWPNTPAAAGSRILLCEGESDALTAMIVLRMPNQGWHVATWQAGATSSPKAGAIPRSWHGREVHICYDNDVFQGPNYSTYVHVAKPGKDANDARRAGEQRLKNLLKNLCPTLQQLNCKPIVRQCPIDPAKHYGGDLRDWATSGGRDFDEWRAFPFEELPELGKVVLELQFDDAFGTVNQPLKTKTQVDALGRDDVLIQIRTQMKCALGSHNACAQCPGIRLFPDGIINLDDYEGERALGLATGNVNEYVARHVVQRPKNCPSLQLIPIEVRVGSQWRGIRPGNVDETSQRNLNVLSEEAPSLSGEVEISGTVYGDSSGGSSVMYANRVVSLDRADVNLTPFAADLMMVTPWATNDAAAIDTYLDARWRDLAHNVTKIHGRRDIQVAVDLLAHSVLHLDAAKTRGWLDIAIFGETRSGKSMTARRMIEHHGLGVIHTAVSNTSRAGLVGGASRDSLFKPGLFPKQNKKMLFMDEWHFIVLHEVGHGREHPMTWLQGARDNGITSGIKIYGTRDIQAAVRFCVLANWIRNQRGSFEYNCQHLEVLYGSPETIARLDFGLPVGPVPSQLMTDETEHFWTRERTRALILRAWGQDHTQVVIDEKAKTYAQQKCADWKEIYDSHAIPLFTPEEKWLSLLRVATAVANLTFSHLPQGDLYTVHVRPVHVEWAAVWLENCWKAAQYDTYSQAKFKAHTIERKFEAEKMLTVNLGLNDADLADALLPCFLSPFTMQELPSIVGKDLMDSAKWAARMRTLRVFEPVKNANMGFYATQLCCTKGGQRLIQNLLMFARNDPQQWLERYNRIAGWGGGNTEPEGLTPMTVENWELLGNDPHNQPLPF